MTSFSDLPHATRLAIVEICEALGARVGGYTNGGLSLDMKPSADKLGWSSEALDLHHTLTALGFEQCKGYWKHPVCTPNDPYADAHNRFYFSAHYTPTRDPLPLCSCNSK